MKLRVEIGAETDEIILRTRVRDGDSIRLEEAILSLLSKGGEMALVLGDTEYFVHKQDILFFETVDGRVKAHTADAMYDTRYKLFELEELMPASFLRVSKSCILNSSLVRALSHNLAGASRVTFQGSDKIVYVSRAYYKILREKIESMRIREYNMED